MATPAGRPGEVATTVEPLVLVLDPGASEQDLGVVLAAARESHPGASVAHGDGWAAVALGDGVRPVAVEPLGALAAVRQVVPVSAPYRLTSREVFRQDLPVEVRIGAGAAQGPVALGGRAPIGLIASSRWAMGAEARVELLAPLLAEAGCRVFHAGRSAGTADPGAEARAWATVRDIVHEHGLALSVEVSDAGQIPLAADVADVVQVGSRNMQDFSLLREMGALRQPVLLKRGAGATVEEFLLAAEYILSHGNGRVILCESGIRTFDALRKPRFEINAVPLLKRLTHLPVVADPSQAAPHAGVVPALARAAVAAGADGLVLEVGTEPMHDPDGAAIDIETLRRLAAELRPISRAVGRSMEGAQDLGAPLPRDAAGILHRTDRTLAQVIESIIGIPPDLEVVAQWRLSPPTAAWLSPPLGEGSDLLGRCTSYRMGAVRLSRNLSYVDLDRIDSTLAVLLETGQLNLGQLFVDPKIEKLHFEFGTHEDAGEIDAAFRTCFPGEEADLHPYVWRRYQAAVRGVVSFVVIEALPTTTWERLLEAEAAPALRE